VPDLLHKLRNLPEFHGLKLIEVMHDPALATMAEQPNELPAIKQLSNYNAKQVLAIADSVADHELANALRRIAKHSCENGL